MKTCLLFILLTFISVFPYPNQYSLNYFDYLNLTVSFDGGINCTITSDIENPPIDVPYARGLVNGYFVVVLYVGGNVSVCWDVDLKSISEVESDAQAVKIVEPVEGWLGVSFDFNSKVKREYQSPIQGYIGNIRYTFSTKNYNPDVIIDKFLSLIPSEGLLSMVSRRIISNGTTFMLGFYVGTKACKLTFSKSFPNYFNFKAGETYTLDIFKLLNFTGPLKIHKMSDHATWIQITLLSYEKADILNVIPDIQAEILNVDFPFEYRVGKITYANRPYPPGFNIENLITERVGGVVTPKFSLTAGDVVDHMRITFKIVKYGFSAGIEFPNVIGISIIMICVFVSIAILYKMRKHKGGQPTIKSSSPSSLNT
ncbi:MAG: hypothetical protein MRT15_03240 [archaeon YNP-LCB-003-016]|nr:hypothetical protein [Candidatus Culexarchaeum yellowstonense]